MSSSVRDHVPLRDRCSFQTGGVAQYYTQCDSLSAVLEALQYAVDQRIGFRVMGNGTGLLVSDGGVQGLVIQNKSHELVFVHDRSQVMIDAGFLVGRLVTQAMSTGYSGLEFLLGWPGTLGGAVYRNASAFGQSIGDYVKAATLYFPNETKNVKDSIRRVDREWFRFGVGTSRLKELRLEGAVPPVILSLSLQLSKMNPASCLAKGRYYHDLWQQQHIPPSPSLQIFNQLTLNAISSDPSRPLIVVSSALVRKWKRNDISVSLLNPNFVIHQGMGVSADTQSLIDQIQTDLHEHGQLVPCIEYLGLER